MNRNSTIRQKYGECPMCPPGKGDQPLIKELCGNHYWQSVRMRSVQKGLEKDIAKEVGLPELISDADAVVSKYVRLSNEIGGVCECFTCNAVGRWQDMDAGHFIPRANLFMRFDVVRNIRVQCHDCNRFKHGNIVAFARKLNEEKEGLADLLIEESSIIYKPSREELKAIIAEYSEKVLALTKNHKAA